MKGTIHRCLGELVTLHFGDTAWHKALEMTGYPSSARFTTYDDIDEEKSLALVVNSAKACEIPVSQIFDMFGEYWVCDYAPKAYSFWYIGLRSPKDFILKLDHIHSLVGKHFNNAEPPRFIYVEEAPNILRVTYQSERGLLDLFISLVKGVGKYFNQPVEVEKLSQKEVRIVFEA